MGLEQIDKQNKVKYNIIIVIKSEITKRQE